MRRPAGNQAEELSDALKQALKNRIDEAVDAGRLTEEQAEALRSESTRTSTRCSSGTAARGRAASVSSRPLRDPRDGCRYLGMSEANLREALEDKTLADLAKEKGKSVDGLVKALVAAQEKKIDEAVADGRITRGAGDGDQVEARRGRRVARQRGASPRRRPPSPRVLAGLGLPARATGFRRPAA